ncbi:Cytochrome b6-f complex subunit 7-like protein [Drosera capensis]
MVTATLFSVSTTHLITSSNRFAHVKNMNPMVSSLRPIAGLRAYNNKPMSLGIRDGSGEPGFGNTGTSLTGSSFSHGRGRDGGGGRGSLLVARNAASEIFKIAAIMNGLVLIGVAVGFILLRIEAAVEEAQE